MAQDPELLEPPPDCGQRLLPAAIDDIARNEPDRVFGVYPKVNTNLSAGFEEVTFGQYANAINKTAWWLEAEKGKSLNHDTLAYLGPNDFRHAVVAIAANKVGYKVLFLSPRNSLEGHLNLIKLNDCRTLITSNPAPPFARALISSDAVEALFISGQDELFQSDVVPVYASTKTFTEARDDPFLVLHTSGSTGLPKPIVWTNGYVAALDKLSWASSPPGSQSALRKLFNIRYLNAMPAFHAGGSILILCYSVFCGLVSVLPPSHQPLDAATAVQILKLGNVQTCILLPSILEDISKDPSLKKEIGKFPYVINSGGPLSDSTISAYKVTTQIINLIGTTEGGVLPHLCIPDPEDSIYVAIHPCAGVEFRQHSDDVYELILVRQKSTEEYQPVWNVFPELEEYSMKDLFSKHPTKPGLWRHIGRTDDIVVLANGEKINPITTETFIQTHPGVRFALVTGEGRSYSALLVEPVIPLNTTAEKAAFLESLWPIVEEANVQIPAHGKIGKSLITFTNPAKPLPRAGKGTVQRKLALQAYEKEISDIYADASRLSDGRSSSALVINTHENLLASMKEVVSQLLGLSNLRVDDDFFAQGGMDSLQVLKLTASIKLALEGLKIATNSLAPSIVYSNPTVEKLSASVMKLGSGPSMLSSTAEPLEIEKMEALLGKYASNLPSRRIPSSKASKTDGHVVMLTGSTGALGSYILAKLCENPQVLKVCCLNRTGGSQRQHIVNESRGLSTDWGKNNVEFLEYNLAEPNFGLTAEIFAQLNAQTTTIIHNAWPVNFNFPLSSFEPQIEGVHALVDFAAQSTNNARIFFISSISSMLNWSSKYGSAAVPEEIVSDPTVASATGYAEAKYIAEQLLHQAHRDSGVAVSICRVGQIAGPALHTKGAWNRQEWFPSMITSSKHLKLLPRSLGTTQRVDWIPIDLLAQAILELALSPDDGRAGMDVHHAVNPRDTTWERLIPSVLPYLGQGVQVVSYEEWLGALSESARAAAGERDWEINPAVKLLPFFEALGHGHEAPVFATGSTEGLSQTMKGLKAIQGHEMELWMRQWGLEAVA